MPAEEQMDINERRKYLHILQRRYQTATRTERSCLLDTMQVVTGLDRKTLIRLMRGDLKRRPRTRQRGHTYDRVVDQALRVIAESYDFICAERLTPNLGEMARQLARHHELELTDDLLARLEQISVSTVRRRLQQFCQDEPRLARRSPSGGNGVAASIPMHRIAWQESQPGHFEVDLVHHAGASSEGQYMHTLQLVDVTTGWSERVAVLGRSYRVMEDGFLRCQARLPFAILELHPDNGSEFLNDLMVRFWKDTLVVKQLSRSRPYQKNDNRFVEQKNRTLVRDVFGRVRLETAAQTNLSNQLYDRLWLYYNFFQPVLRLSDKVIMDDGETHTVKRRFDQARTPFERLCASGRLAAEPQSVLEQLRQDTNPRQLREEIHALTDRIVSASGAKPGQTEDIYNTLLPAGRWERLVSLNPGQTPLSAAQDTSHPTANQGEATPATP